MAGQDTFPLIDRLVEGGLVTFLTEGRRQGDSYQQLAFKLKHHHNVDLSVETVRRWCQRVEAEATA